MTAAAALRRQSTARQLGLVPRSAGTAGGSTSQLTAMVAVSTVQSLTPASASSVPTVRRQRHSMKAATTILVRLAIQRWQLRQRAQA